MREARTLTALALALALSGCSEPAPPAPALGPTVRLSAENPDTNAAAIAAFFRQTCIDASADSGAFEAALHGSGWGPEQIQAASAAMPIAAWRLGHGEIVRSSVSLGPGASFIDCELSLDADVSPSLERMRDTLRPILARARVREISPGPPQVKWEWPPSPREQRDLTIQFAAEHQGGNAMSGRRGLALHFGSAETAPLAPIANETANVQ